MPRSGFEPTLDRMIECTPRAPSEARRAVADLAPDLEAGLLGDMQLVVSELVTNSVKFGPKRSITLSLEIGAEGKVRGEVIDQGDGERAKIEMSPEPSLEGGWGLHLVERVATRWGVHEGSTHVWFEVGPRRRAS